MINSNFRRFSELITYIKRSFGVRTHTFNSEYIITHKFGRSDSSVGNNKREKQIFNSSSYIYFSWYNHVPHHTLAGILFVCECEEQKNATPFSNSYVNKSQFLHDHVQYSCSYQFNTSLFSLRLFYSFRVKVSAANILSIYSP